LRVAGFGAIRVDPPVARGADAILAETGDAAAGAHAAVVRDERVAERALSLASPHQSVDVIRTQVVLHHPEPEVARVRVARAGERRRAAGERDLARFVEAGNV